MATIKKLISLSQTTNEKLKGEENASKLIEQLLTWYYNGAYDTVDLEKQRTKVKQQLVKLTQDSERHTLAFNRLASAVEDLVNQVKESRNG